jgi:hypothetical protein
MHLRVAFKSTSVKGNLTRLYIGGWHGMRVDSMIPSFKLCLVSLHLIAYLTTSMPLQSASLCFNRKTAGQGTDCGSSVMPREVTG